MAITYNGFTFTFEWDNLQRKFDQLGVYIDDAAEEGLDNVGKASVRKAQELVEIRGYPLTPYSRKRYLRGRGNSEGRNDTGNMKYSIDYEVNGDEVTVGWIDNEEEYFIYQEEGTGRIAPMFALRDAATLASMIGPGLVSQSVSRAVRRAGF
jgi:hypothetical protein